jgi:hypothetical protein
MCKSTVDWCEKNYTVVDYIAEFWNTITGLAIAISAIYFRSNHKTSELNNVFWYLILVSIGTILFHATLLYKYQLLDEMPMLLIAMEYLRIVTNLNTFEAVTNSWTKTLLSMRQFFVIVIPLTYAIGPYAQIFSFHATLKMYELTVLYMMYKVSNTLNKDVYSKLFNSNSDGPLISLALEMKIHKKDSFIEAQDILRVYIAYRKKMSNHVVIGSTFYGVSMGLWLIENCFCTVEYIETIQLHAWWHVLSSFGMYHLNMIIKYHILIDNIRSKVK